MVIIINFVFVASLFLLIYVTHFYHRFSIISVYTWLIISQGLRIHQGFGMCPHDWAHCFVGLCCSKEQSRTVAHIP